MKEPTFIIAGAQRCGTTWLYHLLDEHPDVYMAKPERPEPKFFLNEPSRDRNLQWYLDTWFNNANTEIAVGEKSTSYMESPDAPQRMKRSFEKLKVVFLLRHPVERALSHYRFSRQCGLETESLEFAIRNEPVRLTQTSFPHVSVHPFAYQRRGHYARDIARYLEVFRANEVKVICLEYLRAEPSRYMSEIFTFLDVDPTFELKNLTRRFNVSPPDNLRMSRQIINSLLEQFYPSNRSLEELCGFEVPHWDTPSDDVLSMVE